MNSTATPSAKTRINAARAVHDLSQQHADMVSLLYKAKQELEYVVANRRALAESDYRIMGALIRRIDAIFSE